MVAGLSLVSGAGGGGCQFAAAANVKDLLAIVAAGDRRGGGGYGGGYGDRSARGAGDYGGEDGYDNYDAPPKPRFMPQPKQAPGATIMSLMQNQKQLGGFLLAIGFFLSIMGMMLFFEGNLLRLGNICIIVGIPLLIGPDRVRGFFMKQSRIQASIITSIGIILVFAGKPRLGILCEVFGLLNLFGNMFPLLLALAKRFPIVGDIISSVESAVVGGGGGGARRRAPDF